MFYSINLPVINKFASASLRLTNPGSTLPPPLFHIKKASLISPDLDLILFKSVLFLKAPNPIL